MGNQREARGPIIGGSSLLVIFAVLCLTVFALLAMSTVQANGRLADASAEAVSNYYAADCQAEEILARLRSGEMPAGVNTYGDVYSYTCPISETQELQVKVQFSGNTWNILRWQAVSIADWGGDASLGVWDGEILG